MNKRFLSALLAATLMVASTEVFVSCKDYDDDIDAINTELTQIKSQISAIEAKINGGQWITSVTPVTNGFTVTFSGGGSYTITNGKDGADGATGATGADGKNGTQWTISEDGYWVCDGVKTDVKAVGVDGKDGANGADGKDGVDGTNGENGKDGKDALDAVKKENGKWYLWNGTEYEEFIATAVADNVPYYYTDPDDTNYAVLVVYDENGENKQSIRLPLNEGLAQISIVDENTLVANYAIYKVTSATKAWDGAKPLPAKGEYIVTQSMDSIMVQVTPTNYDLAAISSFSLVNSLSEVAPVTVGAPVAYNKLLTRAAAKGGLYKMAVTTNKLTDEEVEKYKELGSGVAVRLSLKANDKVRSGYDLKYQLREVTSLAASAISFESSVKTKPGEPVTIPVEGAEYLYDAYMYAKTAADKADSVKLGLVTEGLTVKSSADASKSGVVRSDASTSNSVTFVIKYCNVLGEVKTQDVTVTFGEDNKEVEFNDNAIDTVAHVATGKTVNQYMLVDFTPYLKNLTENERIYFGAKADLSTDVKVTWSYIDQSTGRETTPYDVTGLVDGGNILMVKYTAQGKLATADKTDFTHLLVPFKKDYQDASNVNVVLGDVEDYGATFTAQIRINDAKEGEDHIVYVPFTIDEPVATEYTSLYKFDPAYYANGTLTLIDIPFDVPEDLRKYVTEGVDKLDYSGAKSSAELIPVGEAGYRYQITRTTPTPNASTGVTPKAPTSTVISGWTVNYMERNFTIPSFTVKFVDSKAYTVVTDSASVSVLNSDTLYYRDVTAEAEVAAAKPNYFYVKDVDGKFVEYSGNVTSVAFYSKDGNGDLIAIANNKYINITAGDDDTAWNITTLGRVTVDVEVPVTVVCTIGGKEYTGEFTVTVKAYPVN